MATNRAALLKEILVMAVETLRANKLRSALTILGVVIGVTSIVGMTSLIRGFGNQLEALINQMGANTVYVAKMSISSLASGKTFFDVLKRPNLTMEDVAAIRNGAPSAAIVERAAGRRAGLTAISRVTRQCFDPADAGRRRHVELGRRQLRRHRRGPLLRRLRGRSPAPGGRPRRRAGRDPVPEHAGDRQEDSHPNRRIHGGRSDWASGPACWEATPTSSW